MAFPIIPSFSKVDGLAAFFKTVARYVDDELRRRPMVNQAMDQTILVAPDGSTWAVRVSNTGVLSTTQLSG